MDLNRYLDTGRRWAWLLALVSSLTSLSTLLWDSRRTPTYESQAQLLVGPALSSSDLDINQLRVSSQLVQVYAELATTRPVLQEVIDELNLDTIPSTLKTSLKVIPLTETQLIKIRARHSSPYWAALIANTLADVLVRRSPTAAQFDAAAGDGGLQDQIARLGAHITEMEADVEAASTGAGSPEAGLRDLRTQLGDAYVALADLYSRLPDNAANKIEIIEPAIPDLSPVSPQIPVDVALGAVVGFVAAAAAALLLEYLNDTIVSGEELTRAAGVAVVGTILRPQPAGGPAPSPLVTLSLGDSVTAEGFRVLRTNLQTLGLDRGAQALLVTSPEAGQGKSETAANLAITFAQAGRRVILVDVDLWDPQIAGLFEIPAFPGLTDCLIQPSVKPPLRPIPHALLALNLRVLASGLVPAMPSGMLTSQRWLNLLQDLRAQADIVILDSPPVLPRASTLVLARQADAVLLTISSGKTRRQSARRAAESLRLAGANLIGAALNAPAENVPYFEELTPLPDSRREVPSPGLRPALPPLVEPPTLAGGATAVGVH